MKYAPAGASRQAVLILGDSSRICRTLPGNSLCPGPIGGKPYRIGEQFVTLGPFLLQPKISMKQDSRFPLLHILDHPLIQHKLTHMRDKNTSTRTFRQLLREITLLMGYEITRDLPLAMQTISTPLTTIESPVIAGKKLAIVPVLRAGIGMSDGLLDLVPSARVGHIGVYRADDHRPVEYLVKLPDLEDRTFILCDPMLATGYSAVHAVNVLKSRGVLGADIMFMALVAAPEGVAVFVEAHPDVKLYVASLDSHLNEHAYIVPGLGDAGDRLFGTKN